MCNTFTQIAAAVADVAPSWLCPLAGEDSCTGGVSLQCASRYFSIDWGSSAWRKFRKDKDLNKDEVIDCGEGHCMPTPLQPDVWADLGDDGVCGGDMDTLADPPMLFGQKLGSNHAHRPAGGHASHAK